MISRDLTGYSGIFILAVGAASVLLGGLSDNHSGSANTEVSTTAVQQQPTTTPIASTKPLSNLGDIAEDDLGFEHIDRNKDQKITYYEAQSIPRLANAFTAVDANSDKHISPHEYDVFVRAMTQQRYS